MTCDAYVTRNGDMKFPFWYFAMYKEISGIAAKISNSWLVHICTADCFSLNWVRIHKMTVRNRNFLWFEMEKV
jgi:hypothetical protein